MSPRDPQTACPGIEELAAFVDGRLTGTARDEMLAHLDDCPTCYEAFVDASRFKAEEGARGEVSELRPRRRPIVARRRFWAAAAALLVATLLWAPRLGLLSRDVVTADLPVALLVDRAGSDGTPFDRTAGWSYARAEGYAAGLPGEQRSFRLGVRLVDLELALRAGDSAAALDLLQEIGDLAASFPLAEHVVIAYDEIERRLGAGEAPTGLLEPSSEAAEWAADVALGAHLALGKWAEAGRLAAEGERPRLFSEKAIRELPHRAAELGLPPDAASALTRIRDHLDAGVEPQDLEELAGAFTDLIAHAANP